MGPARALVVLGDDGLKGIRIGRETPEAEAFTDFQEYVLGLKERGVILAAGPVADITIEDVPLEDIIAEIFTAQK